MAAFIRNDTPHWREQLLRWRKHPLCSRLIKEQMTYQQVRAVQAVYRSGISYEELVSELAKPDGGELVFLRQVGPASVEALRQLCVDGTTLAYGPKSSEYGYA